MVLTCWAIDTTEKFDQLLDEEIDVAVYGHVHKQLLRYVAAKGQTNYQSRLACPI